ncbi:alpha-protein kinase 3-like [Boleophthalmus pectinirostris]|uniref:alpha-protein kinase 3-like n=1 Tax=Boleophthalmus pectinirostris TaxID=150288 RepID=UPI00242CACF2|nr:alpha-protein kinase 3-like [Boleophthalmus pectinirostris]
MAQLTEDVQPSFETTLKSKAVSENCNVKFTCVVSGLPAPELKWYKDDLELDRYCGLPKYEIRRNGKTHTLHIYNCTLDDAAIYQVSASNSKGIVSCSGVLEVGTMSEYQIHQRFFAKLKAKAEKKRQDLEESSKKAAADKEPAPKETPQKSPERTPRKRAISEPSQSPEELLVGAAEKNSQVQEPAPTSPVAPEVKTDGEHALSKKKFKISNSVDAQTDQPSTPKGNTVRSNVMGNGGDNHYDGGMGLAQFLAETLQSQAVEEKQVPNKEEAGKGGGESVKEKTHEEDGKQTVEEEMEVETVQVQAQAQVQERAEQEMKEESKEKAHPTPPIRHKKEHKEQKEQKEHKEHKEHKDHHIPASISSMLHSVKDFFFGKNKKEPHESKPKDTPDSPGVLEPPATPPSYYLKPESLSETRAKDDYGMPTEVAQLQGATSERPKVAEEQEDLCRGDTAPESTAGGGADQAMEVTEEETALSSPQILAEVWPAAPHLRVIFRARF